MVLNLLPCAVCRLCWDEIGPHNFHNKPVWIGEKAIPRVARRVVMPEVCDDCWEAFAEWCRATLGRRRRETQISHSRTSKTQFFAMDWSETGVEQKYARFTHNALDEWLTVAMGKMAAEVMSKRARSRTIAGKNEKALSHIMGQRRAKPRYPQMKEAAAQGIKP
jgi:hypothetical protein